MWEQESSRNSKSKQDGITAYQSFRDPLTVIGMTDDRIWKATPQEGSQGSSFSSGREAIGMCTCFDKPELKVSRPGPCHGPALTRVTAGDFEVQGAEPRHRVMPRDDRRAVGEGGRKG